MSANLGKLFGFGVYLHGKFSGGCQDEPDWTVTGFQFRLIHDVNEDRDEESESFSGSSFRDTWRTMR